MITSIFIFTSLFETNDEEWKMCVVVFFQLKMQSFMQKWLCFMY
jgi:hypothetical protein